ncbi:putative methyltransferase-domain-containing protein [Abortiporus biennis]|nr:putative methyltransferase-domain-containing protein [Abortiporus biennis]
MSDSEDDIPLALDSVFTEPPRPPSPEPTIATYLREKGAVDDKWSSIDIRLVGSHPLWGHYLWNASRAFASYLDANPQLYVGKSVLELGAGGGLPGIVTAKNGASSVVLTDYPDASLIDNLQFNVTKNVPDDRLSHTHVEGYIWGHPIEPLFALQKKDGTGASGFDLIIMSDLIFSHSQHDALLNTCEKALRADSTAKPCLLVFYSHHRPHLAHRDMEFFEKAKQRGWICEEILTEKFPPMFPEDSGAEEVRATVHGWRLVRPDKPS